MHQRLIVVTLAIVFCQPTGVLAQSLTAIRIEGPEQVVEETSQLYSVIAEFDNGWEFDVTLDSFLWMEPGIHAEIGVFGNVQAFAVESDQQETINASYSFGLDTAEASLAITITDQQLFPLVIDNIRPCGRFYVAPLAPFPNDITDSVRVFDRTGNPTGVILEGQIHANHRSAFDLNGNLLVSQWFQDTVLVISPLGEVIRTITGGGLNGPTGVAINPDGNYTVGSYLTDSVKFFAPDGSYLGNLSHPGTEDVHSIAYDRQGHLYVASRNNGNGRIAVFDEDLNFVRYIGSGILVPHPHHLVFDKSEDLWVTMPGSIRKFSRTGELLDTIVVAGLDPSGIAMDENENLYIPDWNEPRIFVLTREGVVLDVLTLHVGDDPDPLYKLASISLEAGADTDCNDNGVGDACDIASGSSPDCNFNAVPDSCDIASGTSEDGDEDGVPDECQSCAHHALQFDGSNDIAVVEGSEFLAYPGFGGWTIEAWLRPDNAFPGIQDLVFGQFSDGPGRDPYAFTLEGGMIKFSVENAQNGLHTVSAPIPEGQWTHVAGVYNGDAHSLSLYLDGQLESYGESSVIPETSVAYPVLFGGERVSNARQFEGAIDEARIWYVARTQCEIVAHMHRSLTGTEFGLAGYWQLNECGGQTITDSSPFQNHGTLGSNAVPSTDDPIRTIAEDNVTLPPFDLRNGWTEPELIPEVSSGDDWAVGISADGLEMYIGSERDGFAQGDIYRTFRDTLDAPFSTPVVVAELSIPGYIQHDSQPNVSANRLRIYFIRHVGFGQGDIFMAQRSSIDAAWGEPAPVESINTPSSEFALALSGDELCLVFTSNRSGEWRYWMATRASVPQSWGSPQLIDALEGFQPRSCALSIDGNTLYVTAEGPTGLGGFDVWMLSRPSTAAEFGPPAHVPELSSEKDEFDVSITGDGRTLYLVRQLVNNAGSVYVSHLLQPEFPIPGDIDCDADVDLDDYRIFSLCETGPGGEVNAGCERADQDTDGDVDLADYRELSNLFTQN